MGQFLPQPTPYVIIVILISNYVISLRKQTGFWLVSLHRKNTGGDNRQPEMRVSLQAIGFGISSRFLSRHSWRTCSGFFFIINLYWAKWIFLRNLKKLFFYDGFYNLNFSILFIFVNYLLWKLSNSFLYIFNVASFFTLSGCFLYFICFIFLFKSILFIDSLKTQRCGRHFVNNRSPMRRATEQIVKSVAKKKAEFVTEYACRW